MSIFSSRVDYASAKAFKQEIVQEIEAKYGKFNDLTVEKVALIQTIHGRYFQQITNDNNRIWTNASLFVPLSLGGLLTLKDSSVMNTFILGIGSTALMFVWVLLAELQRDFQLRSQLIVDAIEQYLNFDISAPSTLFAPRPMRYLFFNVQKIRWMMLQAVATVWILAIAGKVFS